MFSKFITVLTVSALTISGVFASPIARSNGLASRNSGVFSLNNWGGHSTLNRFDDFYGSDNYDGSRNTITEISRDNEVSCHSQQVGIVQQRLAILQEMAKRIITEQICEVEVQAIAFHQFYGGMSSFYHDLFRNSGRSVGYDREITKHWSSLFQEDGRLSSHDLGFNGRSIGTHHVKVSGHNWNDQTSRTSVQSAYFAAENAFRTTSRY